MTKELWHEIACQLAFFELTLDDVATRYGKDLVNAGLEPINFMQKCLLVERKVASRHAAMAEELARQTARPQIKIAEDVDALQLLLLYFDSWYPKDLDHLRYLHWRTLAFTEQHEYAEDLSARIASAEALASVEGILGTLK